MAFRFMVGMLTQSDVFFSVASWTTLKNFPDGVRTQELEYLAREMSPTMILGEYKHQKMATLNLIFATFWHKLMEDYLRGYD